MVRVSQEKMQQYLEIGLKHLVSCERDTAEERVSLYKLGHRGEAWDSNAFLRYVRQGEFNALIAPERLQYEQLPLVTALFLMRRGFLQFQNSQSFQQSFKTSMPTGSL